MLLVAVAAVVVIVIIGVLSYVLVLVSAKHAMAMAN